MKRSPLARQTPLERKTRLRRVPPRAVRRTVSPATPAQRERVASFSCLACGDPHVEPAHLIDRSLAPSWGDAPEIVVPLCRACHTAYDDHDLDLSPYLEPFWRDAIAVAVQAVGLFPAMWRITGRRWEPEAA